MGFLNSWFGVLQEKKKGGDSSATTLPLQVKSLFRLFKEYFLPMTLNLVFKTDEEPREEDIEELLDDVEKYTLASHLFWGLWGIISVSYNSLSLSLGINYKAFQKLMIV